MPSSAQVDMTGECIRGSFSVLQAPHFLRSWATLRQWITFNLFLGHWFPTKNELVTKGLLRFPQKIEEDFCPLSLWASCRGTEIHRICEEKRHI